MLYLFVYRASSPCQVFHLTSICSKVPFSKADVKHKPFSYNGFFNPLIVAHFQGGNKSGLRDLNLAELAHPFFALFLFVEQFPFP